MPRDGSNVYSQPFPDVVEDTTIESTVYNGFTNDVAQDLNAARPVVAGGTGASSATDARFNLATEAATQIVTNYDDHLWVPGSFRSTSSATNPPVASHSFAGWCYINEALANPPTNQNVVVHAFDFDALANTALLYTRQKKAGVWSNWNITTTADNQAGARQAIYAAPFDALSYNGMQINGSMEVSQERVVGVPLTIVSGDNKYIVDGFLIQSLGPQVLGGSFNAGGPPTVGLFNSLLAAVTTAGPATSAVGNFCRIYTPLEGRRVSRLGLGTSAASAFTIGFWVYSTARTGTLGCSVTNGGTRSYTFNVTINATTTWEYKTVTIPGDTTGTWAKDHTTGLSLSFMLSCGTTYMTAANVWTAGNFLSPPGATNFTVSASDQIAITGVVVLPGIEVPSAERSALIMRPYDQELVTCQRYLHRINHGNLGAYSTGLVYSTTQVVFPITYSVMRTTPVAAASAGSTFGILSISGSFSTNTITVDAVDAMSADLILTSSPAHSVTLGQAVIVRSNGTSFIQFDARL